MVKNETVLERGPADSLRPGMFFFNNSINKTNKFNDTCTPGMLATDCGGLILCPLARMMMMMTIDNDDDR